MKTQVQKDITARRKAIEKFQKKYAIKKAAEVIKIFQDIEKEDPKFKVDVKLLRQSVLHNLIEKHKDSGADQEYWSMQLLRKLGLVPGAEDSSDDDGSKDSKKKYAKSQMS